MLGDREGLLKVLRSKYQSELEVAQANLAIMFNKPTSIPEHSNWMAEVDKWVTQIADITDKVAVINAELTGMDVDQTELNF